MVPALLSVDFMHWTQQTPLDVGYFTLIDHCRRAEIVDEFHFGAWMPICVQHWGRRTGTPLPRWAHRLASRQHVVSYKWSLRTGSPSGFVYEIIDYTEHTVI